MKAMLRIMATVMVLTSGIALAATIEPDLANRLAAAGANEKLPVEFIMKEQPDALRLDPGLPMLPKAERRVRVARVLSDHAAATQRDVLDFLKTQEAAGKAEGIVSLWIVNEVAGFVTADVVNALAVRDDIADIVYGWAPCDLAVAKQTLQPHAAPVDGIEPNLVTTNARGAWKQGYTGQNVVLAVIDTGVWWTHEDLRNHLWVSSAYPHHGFNYASVQLYPGATNPSPYDTLTPLDYYTGVYHGTHCAGIATADGNYGNGTHDTMGVAPSTKLMCLPVLVYFNGDSERVMEQSVLLGYQFAISPPRDPTAGADVITMSLGIFYSRYPRRWSFRQAETNLMHAGLIHMVAAGNEGPGNRTLRCPGDCPPPWPNPANNPTDHDSSAVITIGATDNSDAPASFTSWGPSDWGGVPGYNDYLYPPGCKDPDVMMPGVNIYSTMPNGDTINGNTGYQSMSGTSMATPGSAGAVALMLSKNPNLGARGVDSILELCAVTDLGYTGKDDTFGAGRINCSLAVAFTPLPTGIRTLRYIIDDSAGGNNDHVINPGETINLPLWVINLNGYPTLGVSGTLRKDTIDPNFTLIDTVKNFGDINTDDSAFTGSNGFKFSVAGGCSNGYALRMTLVCRDASDSIWTNPLGLMVGTASLVGAGRVVHDPPPGGNGNGNLDPNETADLEIGIRNVGLGNAANVVVHLVSGDARFQILDSIGTYGAIEHDTTIYNTADQFRVHADATIPREFMIQCTLRISANGYSATRPYQIPCGVLTILDPIPDGPRTPALYYAYDDVDSFYVEHPDYNWIELRGRGTRLTLDDDQTVQVSLPVGFGPFKYYGTDYTQVSVCGNGFIMPGSFSLTTWTNEELPTTNMAAPMICGSWDDLYPPTGGGVWWFRDTLNHAFVVEWDSVAYYSPQTTFDKFEIVLYDSTQRGLGDNNEFAFQYYSANNYGSNTVGEQDPTQQIGINALFDGAYHRACAPVVAGRAIKFTTDTIATGITEPAPGFNRARLVLRSPENPFRGTGRVMFSLPSATPARLMVYDISGRQVRLLLSSNGAPLKAGSYALTWNGADDAGREAAGGIYFYRLETGLGVLARKTVKLD
jgi:subtilisin family serine protease